MTAKEFVDGYNYLFDEVVDGTYEIDKILSKYDSDGNLDLYEIYEELSAEDKDKIADLLSIPDESSTQYNAYELYFNAWMQMRNNPDQYSQGIIDFYEALKAEGLIDLSYFDDEE